MACNKYERRLENYLPVIKKTLLKIEIAAEKQAECGNIGITGISESFDKIYPNDRKNVINPDTGLHIGLAV